MLDRVYVTSCQKFVSNFFTVLELLWEKSRKRGVESKSAFSLHPAPIPSRPVPLFPYGDFFCLHFSPLYEVSGLIYPRGVTPRKILWGVCGLLPKTPYPRPIYDQNSLFQTNGFIDNDENVASSKKKHTQFKTRVRKSYPVYDQKGQNRCPSYLWPKRMKTISFRAAHTYIGHIREYPPPEYLHLRRFVFVSGCVQPREEMQRKHATNKRLHWAVVSLGRKNVWFYCHWHQWTRILASNGKKN